MLALALLAITPLRFHFDATPFTNAVYHLACLAGSIGCSSKVYSDFWNSDYAVTREDGAKIEQFKKTLGKIMAAAPDPPRAPFLGNYLSFYPSLRIRSRILATAVEAGSAEKFRHRAERFLDRADAAALADSLSHFERRLSPWWSSPGRQRVETHIAQVDPLMRKGELIPLASQVAKFVGADFHQRDVWVHAVPGPSTKTTDASATVIGNHFFVEVQAKDAPEATVWKAMHELTHAFYDSAPMERHLSLMNQFLVSSQPGAQSFYLYLNEAVATAVQLLVLERAGQKDDDPYRQRYIPRLARSTAPLLKQMLSSGGTLYDGFVDPYLRAGAMELKGEVTGPLFVLSVAAVLTSKSNEAAAQQFYDQFTPIFNVNTEKEWRLFSNLNAIRLVTFDELPDDAFPGVVDLKRKRGFAWAEPHGPKGQIFVLAGRNGDTVVELVKRLSALPSVDTNGVLFTLQEPGTHRE